MRYERRIRETTKERGATILIPSSMVDTLNLDSASLLLTLASKSLPDRDLAPRRDPETPPQKMAA